MSSTEKGSWLIGIILFFVFILCLTMSNIGIRSRMDDYKRENESLKNSNKYLKEEIFMLEDSMAIYRERKDSIQEKIVIITKWKDEKDNVIDIVSGDSVLRIITNYLSN